MSGTPDPVQVAGLTFWCGPRRQPNALASLLGYQLSGQVHHFGGPVAITAAVRQDFTPASLTWLLRAARILAGQNTALIQFQQAGEIHQIWHDLGTPGSVHGASTR